MEATQLPVHSGGNRLGFSPNFPCRPHGHLRRSNPTTSSWSSDCLVTKNRFQWLTRRHS